MSCAISQIDIIVSTGLSNIASSCSSWVQIKDAGTLARGEKCRSGEVLGLFRHQSGVAHAQSGRQESRKSVLHHHGTTRRVSKQTIAPTSKLQKSFVGNKSHGKSLARCASYWAKWLAALASGTERYMIEYIELQASHSVETSLLIITSSSLAAHPSILEFTVRNERVRRRWGTSELC